MSFEILVTRGSLAEQSDSFCSQKQSVLKRRKEYRKSGSGGGGGLVILDSVFQKIAPFCKVKKTEAIWCFALFVTNLKIDNDPHFWEG